MAPIADTAPEDRVTRAAALLDAVARDSESAVDFEVPLRCGVAANRLHAHTGTVPTALPTIGDDATAIAAAVADAIDLLMGLPAENLSDAVLDALSQVR